MWLGLINQEADKVERCRGVLKEARDGKIQIWTSALTLAEVFKAKCSDGNVSLQQEKDQDFENFVDQEFLTLVQVDHEIGTVARRLLRNNSKLKKPTDAIHLATAVVNNLDELHTYDEVNLIPLSGLVRDDGKTLTICWPPECQQPELPGLIAGE
jgi:predicted nucleic acid-binding protein